MSISTLTKRIILLPLIGGLALLMLLPMGAEAASSKVTKAQLNSYINQFKPLVATENSIIKRYGSVTGSNYTDDATTFAMLQKLLPDTNKYISRLEAIQPTNPTLRKIHQGYIDAWNAYAESYTLFMGALQNSDYSAMAAGNKALARARTLVLNWQASLKALSS